MPLLQDFFYYYITTQYVVDHIEEVRCQNSGGYSRRVTVPERELPLRVIPGG